MRVPFLLKKQTNILEGDAQCASPSNVITKVPFPYESSDVLQKVPVAVSDEGLFLFGRMPSCQSGSPSTLPEFPHPLQVQVHAQHGLPALSALPVRAASATAPAQ